MSTQDNTENTGYIEEEEIQQCNWIMEYCELENETVRCSICKTYYENFEPIEEFKTHIIDYHNEIYQNNVKDINTWVWDIFYITENNMATCSICSWNYVNPPFDIISMRNHLMNEHNVNEVKALRLYKWIRTYVDNLNVQDGECTLCRRLCNVSNSYNLMIHVIKDHDKPVPVKFTPKEK